jgi:hypothetical protein
MFVLNILDEGLSRSKSQNINIKFSQNKLVL